MTDSQTEYKTDAIISGMANVPQAETNSAISGRSPSHTIQYSGAGPNPINHDRWSTSYLTANEYLSVLSTNVSVPHTLISFVKIRQRLGFLWRLNLLPFVCIHQGQPGLRGIVRCSGQARSNFYSFKVWVLRIFSCFV